MSDKPEGTTMPAAAEAHNVDSDGKRLPRTLHCALSVDVDRFSDAKLRKQYDGILIREDGTRVSWRDLRALCREYRAKGFEVFPPCDNVNERGACQGHGPDGEP